jgi:hypothetical protein
LAAITVAAQFFVSPLGDFSPKKKRLTQRGNHKRHKRRKISEQVYMSLGFIKKNPSAAGITGIGSVLSAPRSSMGLF